MLKTIWNVFWRRYRARAFLAVVLLTISGLFGGVTIAALLPLINTVFQGVGDESGLIQVLFVKLFDVFHLPLSATTLLVFVLAISIMKSLAIIGHQVLMRSIELDLEAEKKQVLFSRLLGTRLPFLQQSSFGWITSIIMRQTVYIGKLLEWFSRFAAGLANIVFYVIVSLLVSAHLAVLTTFTAGIFYFLIKPLLQRAKAWGHRSAEGVAVMQENVNYLLGGFKTIRSFVREYFFRNRFNAGLKRYMAAERRIVVLESLLQSVFEPLALLIGITAYALFRFDLGTFVVFGVALSRSYQNLQILQKAHYRMTRHYASLEIYDRMKTVLESNREEQAEGESFTKLQHGVDFENVVCRRGEGDQSFVLGPVSLSFPKGKTMGVVGVSGSGKSTVVDLLAGFLRVDSGRITIDGRNISSFSTASLRKRIGYVTQEVFLMNDTIWNNIRLGDEKIQKSRIREACRLANADQFIEELPEGYDSVIGEGGAKLSGGQRQRIALARALVNGPDILILDEATSALDTESERTIRKAIEELRGRMLIIIIAHRLSTVTSADQIYVLENGQLVEEGNFEELLSRRGRFSKMHTAG